jgi:hypothetical protein
MQYNLNRRALRRSGIHGTDMSRQLKISSLFSAFALVCLCLFARAGTYAELPLGDQQRVVYAQQAAGQAS